MSILKTENFKIAVNTYGEADAPRLAILMPGRLDTKDYTNFNSHGEYLAERGFFAIAMDPPTTWDSPGDLSNYTTSSYVQSVNELITFYGNRPTVLVGHSRGGATAMLASANPAVKGIALVNAAYGSPTTPDPDRIHDGRLIEFRDIPPGDKRTIEQKRFALPLAYFEDGSKHDPVSVLKNFQGAKLLIIASHDEFTPVARVKEVFDALSEPKTFLEINGAHDYRLSKVEIDRVNDALGELIKKC